ncbi:hypothetical protein AK812_SmicGene43952 [Symbiodinium microadriaticum]|uniref:Uncharacterized protein n=1 Tax=Symbiodinium microadriaticum TaxID=2951 RepID=A0A1Q9BZP9_SYMMI|nr:hypothetical protein AK812_SmicGene43952 [Symbiodinium microadriaticum]
MPETGPSGPDFGAGEPLSNFGDWGRVRQLQCELKRAGAQALQATQLLLLPAGGVAASATLSRRPLALTGAQPFTLPLRRGQQDAPHSTHPFHSKDQGAQTAAFLAGNRPFLAQPLHRRELRRSGQAVGALTAAALLDSCLSFGLYTVGISVGEQRSVKTRSLEAHTALTLGCLPCAVMAARGGARWASEAWHADPRAADWWDPAPQLLATSSLVAPHVLAEAVMHATEAAPPVGLPWASSAQDGYLIATVQEALLQCYGGEAFALAVDRHSECFRQRPQCPPTGDASHLPAASARVPHARNGSDAAAHPRHGCDRRGASAAIAGALGVVFD